MSGSAPSSGHSKLDRRDGYVLAGFLLFLLIFFSGVLAQPGERCLGRQEGDGRSQFYGWRAYGFGEVRAGRFPLWNPYEFLGMPFVASLQSAMFYPTNWLCAALPLDQLGRAINLGILLNLFLSGLFTYLWARRFGLRWLGATVAAAAYVFGAPQILRIFEGHWSFLAPMAWIPCVLLCVEMLVGGRQATARPRHGHGPCRGRLPCQGGFQPLAIVLGAAAVAMEWFGGNPQYAFYGGIAAVLYLAGRLWQRPELGARGAARAIGGFALIYLLGSALAGVQLMPALELFSISSRRGQLTYSWVTQYSFVPEGLLNFLAPDLFGTDVGMRYWGRWNLWEMSPYVGVVAFGLAFIALLRGRRGRAWLPGCIALIGLLLAMCGDALFFGLVPGFDLFRSQARWLCPVSLFIGLLAGLGADGIAASVAEAMPVEPEKRLSRADRRGMWILACLAALLILIGVALYFEAGFGRTAWLRFMDAMLNVGRKVGFDKLGHKLVRDEHVYFHDWTPSAEFRLVAMRAAGLDILRAGLFLGALASLIRLAALSRLKPAWVAAALLALVAFDAWTFGHRYLVTFDPQKDGLSQDAVKFLAKQPEPFRYWRGGCGTLPACEGMTHGFACIEGVQPNVPARFRDVFWSLQGERIYTQARERKFTSYFIYNPLPALLMLNVRYAVAYLSQPQMKIEGLQTVHQDRQIRIDELPDHWPRAWLVHRFETHSSQEVLSLLPQFNYEKIALFEEKPGCAIAEPSEAAAALEIVRIERYEPSRIDIEVHAAAPALLVLSDLFYPGWEATVDGRPAEILRANYVMRAVAVPQGAHEVRFLYRPASFRAGVAASAVGCLAVALLISWHFWTRPSRPPWPGEPAVARTRAVPWPDKPCRGRRGAVATLDPAPAPISINRRDILVLAGFLVFLLIFFSGILTMPGARCLGRVDSDARTQFYGWRAYGFGEIRAGRFPLWNPYEFLGMPFIASFQSAMFYPTNWLCAALPMSQLGRAINWGIVLNLFLSGMFAYLWCRRAGLRWTGSAVAAAAYVFGAPQILHVFEGHWSFLAAMPWIPCLMLCMEELAAGRWSWGVVAGGAGAVAMQLFAGQPQYVFYSAIAAVLYFAGRLWQEMRKRPREACKAAAGVALIYSVGALAAGVQFLPALELFSISSRRGLTCEFVGEFSLVPEALLTLVAPDFFGSDLLGKYWGRWNLWEMSAYVGVIAVGLALLGALWGKRRAVLLAGFMIVALLVLALGENTPALDVLYRYVPGFNLFRGPARFLAPLSLFLAFLAGIGADLFVGAADGAADAEAGRRLGLRSRRAAWILAVLALLLAAGGVLLLPHRASALEAWPRFMRFIWRQGFGEEFYLRYRGGAPQFVPIALREASSSVLRAAALLGALALLAWTMAKFRLARRGGLKTPAVAAVLFLLLAADYWTFGRRYLVTFDPAGSGLTPLCVDWLRGIPEPFRFARGGDLNLSPCEGMTNRLCCLEGVQPNVPARFRDAFWQLQALPNGKQQTLYDVEMITPQLSMLNLNYLVCHRDFPTTPMPGLQTIWKDDRVRVDALPDPWPRAWLVHRCRVIGDPAALLHSLGDLDYKNVVLLETDPGCRLEVPKAADPFPIFERREPGRIVLKVEAASDALLVLSDLHYPGWRAEVDGRPADILRANYLMRAVAVPAGRHTVHFVYEPASFKAGIAASLAGGLAIALMVLLHFRSRRYSGRAA